MHFAIATTWGPTETTRASLPFMFASSALQAGDSAMIMLFHDSVFVAVDGTYEMLIPVGLQQRFTETFSNPNAEIIVSKTCAIERGVSEDMLLPNCRFGEMNDFNAHAALNDCKVVSF